MNIYYATPFSSTRDLFIRLLIIGILLFLAAPAVAQDDSRAFYVKVHGGVSSYLGDNNIALFNKDAFTVENKWPYLFTMEMGYQWNPRWRAGISSVFADYPIITQFNQDMAIESHPTTRTSYQVTVNHLMGSGKLRPFAQIGMHLTFGEVSIFEATRINNNAPPLVHDHFMWGPVFGLGFDYSFSQSIALMVLASANATFVDDSADGRLPLGPPLPTNLSEPDRFAPFDLLSGLSVGLVFKPFCKSGCQPLLGLKEERGRNKGRSMLRLTTLFGKGMTTVSYYYALTTEKRLYLGVETGMAPKSIFVRFLYNSGLEKSDNINFADAFAGLSLRYVGKSLLKEKVSPYVGVMGAIPRQAQFAGGMDYSVTKSLSLGVEGRFTLCPSRDQEFYMHEVQYFMKSACEYRIGAGLTSSYRF